MIDKKRKLALKKICERLKDKDINWAIFGSVSLALQGVNVEPRDIDILTDKKGALKIRNALKDYEFKEIKFREDEWKKKREGIKEPIKIKSYYGELEINGIKVEVAGELQKFINEKWTKPQIPKERKLIKVNGFGVPIIPLERELEAYRELGRKEKAKKIKKFLKRK